MAQRRKATAHHYQQGMDERSTRVAERLETPMLIAAALTLPMVALTESRPGGWLQTVAVILNWATWLAFAIELVVMLAVVPDRRAWLRHHPLDATIVVLTPPILPPGLQALRVLRLFRLLRLLRLAQLTHEVFSLQGLRYAMLLSLLTVIGGGALFVAFERGSQHLDTWDGIYWAITTMTTLGSNIYPTTTGGEIVSTVILIDRHRLRRAAHRRLRPALPRPRDRRRRGRARKGGAIGRGNGPARAPQRPRAAPGAGDRRRAHRRPAHPEVAREPTREPQ